MVGARAHRRNDPPNHGFLVGVLVVVKRQVCLAPVLCCFRLLAVGPLLRNDPRAARVNRLAPGRRGLGLRSGIRVGGGRARGGIGRPKAGRGLGRPRFGRLVGRLGRGCLGGLGGRG
eukprot:6999415-Pyramimonas_sp.AAC.2